MFRVARSSPRPAVRLPLSLPLRRWLSSSGGGRYFDKLLIANRGEIACRVIRSCKKLGIKTVAVYSEPDAHGNHVLQADEAVCIGPAASTESYLRQDRILAAIEKTGAQAVHPGYGFLSENSSFSNALAERGVAFVGPGKYAIDSMGDKIQSKKIAQDAKVNTIPGYVGAVDDENELIEVIKDIGYPVMIKASAGGGGKGMRIAWDDEEAKQGFRLSRQEAAASFGDDTIFVEKFVEEPRHIEIQVLLDSHGNGVYLNERECSIQRRNQKVIEEAPSVVLDPETRKAMGEQALALAKAVDYESAGTVEFLLDKHNNFYFLEMNTRLQVEHPISELITGVDLVEQMIRVAAGEKLEITQDDIGINGWAIESRVYAEDPYREFLPSTGILSQYQEPSGDHVRCDTGVREGSEISMFYDPMISKLCTHGKDRAEALERMRLALDEYRIQGVKHNIPFLRSLCDNPHFIRGELTTQFIQDHYPEGFQGSQMLREDWEGLVCAVSLLHKSALEAKASLSGVGSGWVDQQLADSVVQVDGGAAFQLQTKINDSVLECQITDLEAEKGSGVTSALQVEADYKEGKRGFDLSVYRAGLDGIKTENKIQVLSSNLPNYHLVYRGEEYKVSVVLPEVHELRAHMPVVEPLDLSKMILSPMPGLVFSINVKEGDVVKAGDEVCVVEAMKMQNSLPAMASGVVSSVKVEVGQSVDADQLLVEFEKA